MSGRLYAFVHTEQGGRPVAGARVTLRCRAGGTPVTLTTGPDGLTETVTLPAPPAYLSREPDYIAAPYGVCNADVEAEGCPSVRIEGIQTFDGIGSVLPVELGGAGAAARAVPPVTVIPPTAVSEASPRDPEAPPASRAPARVLVAEYIVVHLGEPDAAAPNVRVPFADYAANVACSEIYPTWPENALRANLLAIVGFALHRVCTEWYTGRGYDFQITNSPAYDMAFVNGRNIFDNIRVIADALFTTYPRRTGQTAPLFPPFCNGTTAVCGGLSQWGSVTLANYAYTPLGILRYSYGGDVELATAPVAAPTESYPGLLRQGSRGEAVEVLKRQLLRVARNYPLLPRPEPDGIFGSKTRAAVEAFQRQFGMIPDGLAGRATWYRLSAIYTAVRRLAEIEGEADEPDGAQPYPGFPLRQGMRGETVRLAQRYLRDIAAAYPALGEVDADGVFGPTLHAPVTAFQRLFGLVPDGVVGPRTWAAMLSVWRGLRLAVGG